MKFYPVQIKPIGNRSVYVELKDGGKDIYTYHNGWWFDSNKEVNNASTNIVHWCYCDEIVPQSPLNEIEFKVLKWARDRNLIDGSNPAAQFVKLIEEAGELAGNIARNKDVRDDIGDMLVVLTIIAAQCDLDLTECFELAYNDIKDRKGKMLDGVFVKEETQICEVCGESFIEYCLVCDAIGKPGGQR